MAAPPKLKRLSREDFSSLDGKVVEGLDKLFQVLNPFLNDVTTALSKGLTLGENAAALVKTVEFVAPASSSSGGTAGTLPRNTLIATNAINTSTASASFADLFTGSFTQDVAGQQVEADLTGYAFLAATATFAEFRIEYDGVASSAKARYLHNASEHSTIALSWSLAGSATTGSKTVKVQWRRSSGASTILINTNDQWALRLWTPGVAGGGGTVGAATFSQPVVVNVSALGRVPIGCTVLHCQDISGPSPVAAPMPSLTQEFGTSGTNQVVKINAVTGLTAGNKYRLTLCIWGG